jgi:hypothetical protein
VDGVDLIGLRGLLDRGHQLSSVTKHADDLLVLLLLGRIESLRSQR